MKLKKKGKKDFNIASFIIKIVKKDYCKLKNTKKTIKKKLNLNAKNGIEKIKSGIMTL